MASSAPARINGHGISLSNLQTLKKGSINAAKGVANNMLAQALRATAEAERRGAAPSGTNVHKIGNKIVVGAIRNITKKQKKGQAGWIMNRYGHWVPDKSATASGRLQTVPESEQPQSGIAPLRIPLGAFPAPRGEEPGSPGTEPTSVQSSNKEKKRKARKTRRKH